MAGRIKLSRSEQAAIDVTGPRAARV